MSPTSMSSLIEITNKDRCPEIKTLQISDIFIREYPGTVTKAAIEGFRLQFFIFLKLFSLLMQDFGIRFVIIVDCKI